MAARILIAEDHPPSLDLMRYLLGAHGHVALPVVDGEQAIEAVRDERPDLIICDLQMPRANGYEVVRRIKGDPELRHIPMLAVTAFSMLGDREEVLKAGFDGYFSKPIEPERFVSDIEAFLPPALRSGAGR